MPSCERHATISRLQKKGRFHGCARFGTDTLSEIRAATGAR